jgi:hypothetical protein
MRAHLRERAGVDVWWAHRGRRLTDAGEGREEAGRDGDEGRRLATMKKEGIKSGDD